MLVAVVVLLLTVGKAYFSLPGVWEAENQRVRQVRLDPLETLRASKVWWGPWINVFGNIALFLPVGFVAYRGSIARATFFGFAVSLGIEVSQYVFAAGHSDIEDLICNTAGAFLGAAFAPRLRNTATMRALAVACVVALGAFCFATVPATPPTPSAPPAP